MRIEPGVDNLPLQSFDGKACEKLLGAVCKCNLWPDISPNSCRSSQTRISKPRFGRAKFQEDEAPAEPRFAELPARREPRPRF
jgi:hypothetical protein